MVLWSSGAAAPLLLAVRVELAVGGGLQAGVDAELTDPLAVEIFHPFGGAQKSVTSEFPQITQHA